MSGRSAYVRKKITDTKTGEKGTGSARGRSKSGSTWVSGDDGSIYEHPMPQGTGFGTTNARLLKFSDPAYDGDSGHYRSELANHGNSGSSNDNRDSQSGSSENDRREGSAPGQGPMPDYAYARARKPVLKTEDVSGIERSGFRSVVDKRSDDIRKGLTKAFTLGLRKKKEILIPDRAPSSATIRPHYHEQDDYDISELPAIPSLRMRDPDNQPIVSPPPSSKLPPIPPSAAPSIKRWIGAGRPVQRWNKLRKDPELWDPNGDVLVYFGRKDQPQRPNPSFRLSSHIIEATESRLLVTLLREGSTEDDYAHINLPPSPVGAPPMLRHNSYVQAGQATPPISEDNAHADIDGQISYEMYFPTPPHLTKIEAHRHAITTRNVFALLYHASLVGLSLFQALQDLLERLEAYMEPDADNVGTILNYLSARGIDDSRNDAETAVSMLAWSETPEVRWEEGWREAFLHCAGMYARLEDCADFRHLTAITKALLERACLETQLRVQAAEERLVAFTFADAWGPVASSNPGRAAAERLQQFFVSHYAKTWGTWPPTESDARIGMGDGEEMWLTRTVAQALQRDFGALYDYLVNRDIVWDESEMRSSRKWMMVSESGNKSFDADTDDLPLTDLLIEFDNRMRFPHIPHPYPLVPDSIMPGGREGREKGKKDKGIKAADDRTLERRVQLAYTEATNIYSLGSDFTQSDLIESFVKFEKTDQVGAVDPFRARRGRWVLIYAVLQTLASVSVDGPSVRYKDGVAYHLSPRLKGTRTPPWKGASSSAMEASHELSHCWVAPRTWHQAADSAESDTSAASTGTDPVVRMMRSRAHQKFPKPPASTTSRASRTSRTSHAAWQAAGAMGSASASARSSNTTTPTMWGGSSAVSVSNYSDDTAASSAGRMMLSAPPYKGLPRPPPSRNCAHDYDGTRSERSAATFGPRTARARANHAHVAHNAHGGHPVHSASTSHLHAQYGGLPIRGPGSGASSPQWPTRTHSVYRSQPPAPLDLSLGVTGKGDFLADLPYTPSSGGDAKEIPLSPHGSESLSTIIRDFDELDSVVEESAYEKMM
ncbi:hypothetical protein F4777DRAFT_366547 [Nemania sp. FL0916]|nr:hypothetical protein F4777DRAFT_366547 [Nemania sp. FL0916]